MTSVLSATPYAKSATGLKATPTYEQLIEYIRKDPDTITFPDRRAKIARNSFWLSQLDGEGWNAWSNKMRAEQSSAMSKLLIKEMSDALGLDLRTLQALADNMNMEAVPGEFNPDREPQPYRWEKRKTVEALPWFDDQRPHSKSSPVAENIFKQPSIPGKGPDDNPIIPGVKQPMPVKIKEPLAIAQKGGKLALKAGRLGASAFFKINGVVMSAFDIAEAYGPEALGFAYWASKGTVRVGGKLIELGGMGMDQMLRIYEWSQGGQNNDEDDDRSRARPNTDDTIQPDEFGVILPVDERQGVVSRISKRMHFRRKRLPDFTQAHESDADTVRREQHAVDVDMEQREQQAREDAKRVGFFKSIFGQTGTDEPHRVTLPVRERRGGASGSSRIDVEGVTWVDMTHNNPPTQDLSRKKFFLPFFNVATPRWMKRSTFQAYEALQQEQALVTGQQYVTS